MKPILFIVQNFVCCKVSISNNLALITLIASTSLTSLALIPSIPGELFKFMWLMISFRLSGLRNFKCLMWRNYCQSPQWDVCIHWHVLYNISAVIIAIVSHVFILLDIWNAIISVKFLKNNFYCLLLWWYYWAWYCNSCNSQLISHFDYFGLCFFEIILLFFHIFYVSLNLQLNSTTPSCPLIVMILLIMHYIVFKEVMNYIFPLIILEYFY